MVTRGKAIDDDKLVEFDDEEMSLKQAFTLANRCRGAVKRKCLVCRDNGYLRYCFDADYVGRCIRCGGRLTDPGMSI